MVYLPLDLRNDIERFTTQAGNSESRLVRRFFTPLARELAEVIAMRWGNQARTASLAGSPAMRLCHITRGSVMSHGVARWSKQRLSHTTASPGVQS